MQTLVLNIKFKEYLNTSSESRNTFKIISHGHNTGYYSLDIQFHTFEDKMAFLLKYPIDQK